MGLILFACFEKTEILWENPERPDSTILHESAK